MAGVPFTSRQSKDPVHSYSGLLTYVYVVGVGAFRSILTISCPSVHMSELITISYTFVDCNFKVYQLFVFL